MVLADLFQGDPGTYGRAKSRIDISIMSLHVVGPVIGAHLSSISLRLPWAINTLTCTATIGIVHRYLKETLPKSQRVPFRFVGSNPLSFLSLFTRGAKLRMFAVCHLCDYFLTGSGWEKPTHLYDEMHTQTLFGWNLMQRGRYNSFRSLCSLPASWVTGRLMSIIGPRSLLFFGQSLNMLESSLASVATRGWHFFALRPLGGFNQVCTLGIPTCDVLYKKRICQDSLGIDKNGTMEDKLRHCFHVNAQNTLRMAMDYTSSAIGKECGVAQVHVINVSLSR